MDSPLLVRLPPSNLHAEQALLGALLANNKAFERVADFLEPAHFADPIHARIYAAIQRRQEAGQLADLVTLRAEFENAGMLDEVGGVKYLAQLLSAMVGVINAGEYGRVIHDCWLRRELIDLGEILVNRAHGSEADAEARELLDVADERLTQLAGGLGGDAPLVSAGAAAEEALRLCEAARSRRGGLTGITTGYAALDRMTGGWRPGEFILIGARPSMGKTALAAGMAARAAAAGARVLFVSAEMAAEQIAARLVAAIAELPVMAVLRGAVVDPGDNRFRQLSAEEGNALVLAQRRAGELPLHFQDRGAMTVAAIRARARRLARQRDGGLDAIFVDYLGLLRASSEASRQNRNAEVGEISQGLKRLAMELRVPVIALSQLSREVERRDDKTPQLSDLRDSGTLEQDADVVGFLYRQHYYLEREKPTRRDNEKADAFDKRVSEWHDAVARCAGRGELILAKQRQGPVGRIPLRFAERLTWFFDDAEPADAAAL